MQRSKLQLRNMCKKTVVTWRRLRRISQTQNSRQKTRRRHNTRSETKRQSTTKTRRQGILLTFLSPFFYTLSVSKNVHYSSSGCTIAQNTSLQKILNGSSQIARTGIIIENSLGHKNCSCKNSCPLARFFASS